MLKDFDLKRWTYQGNRLANPLLIAWRGVWWLPLQVFLVLTCLCAWIGFGRDAAEQIWKEVN